MDTVSTSSMHRMRRTKNGNRRDSASSPSNNLGFPPDVGDVDVRTGAGGDDTDLVVGGIPGGVAGVRVLVYVGAGVGVDAVRPGRRQRAWSVWKAGCRR
jgi:hypothetical protein